MSEKIEKTLVAELVLDYTFYPRGETGIDRTNVRGMKRALEAGKDLPPIRVDRKSRRVADGFHRVTTYREMKLEKIPVVWKNYPDEASMLEDAIRCNIHGRPLSEWDRRRCVILGRRLGLSDERLADALWVKVDVVLELREGTAESPDDGPEPLKATVLHLAGTTLTRRQMNAMPKVGGPPLLFFVNQLRHLLRSGLVDWANPRAVEGLKLLHTELGAALAVQAKRGKHRKSA